MTKESAVLITFFVFQRFYDKIDQTSIVIERRRDIVCVWLWSISLIILIIRIPIVATKSRTLSVCRGRDKNLLLYILVVKSRVIILSTLALQSMSKSQSQPHIHLRISTCRCNHVVMWTPPRCSEIISWINQFLSFNYYYCLFCVHDSTKKTWSNNPQPVVKPDWWFT